MAEPSKIKYFIPALNETHEIDFEDLVFLFWGVFQFSGGMESDDGLISFAGLRYGLLVDARTYESILAGMKIAPALFAPLEKTLGTETRFPTKGHYGQSPKRGSLFFGTVYDLHDQTLLVYEILSHLRAKDSPMLVRWNTILNKLTQASDLTGDAEIQVTIEYIGW